jgi:lysophospholipase L1-like esterase
MEVRVININDMIKTMSLKNHVEFVDFGKDFLSGNTIDSKLFVGDGLHPNADGYDVLGKDLMKILKK